MTIGQPTIGVTRHVALHLLESVGRDACEAALANAGMSGIFQMPSDATIPLETEAEFVQVAAEISGDIDIGFRAGVALSVATALPGYVSSTSRTLGDAMRDAARLLPVVRPGIDFRLDMSGNVVALRMTLSDPTMASYPRHHEFLLAAVVGQVRSFTARPFHPEALSFSHARVPVERRVRGGVGCEISFGSETTEMLITPEALSREIRGRDDALRALLVSYGETLREELERRGLGFSEQVELYVQSCLPDDVPDAEAAARSLGVSRRTLSRRLAEAHTTFGDIVTHVRLRIAARELRESTLQVSEIAARLGYASPSAFTAAFRRATGLTPREFRAVPDDHSTL
ncbi:MAG: AraC family transcriptional regulator ligand-binding domain-containing protein [Pseudomonadota bacterium]